MKNPLIFDQIDAVGVEVDCQDLRELISVHRTAYLVNETERTAVLLFRTPTNDLSIKPEIRLLKTDRYPPVDQLEETQLQGDIHSLGEFPGDWTISHGEAANEPGNDRDDDPGLSESAQFLSSLLGDSVSYITAIDPDSGPRDAMTLRLGNYAAASVFLEKQGQRGRNLYFGFNGVDSSCEFNAGRPKAKKAETTVIHGFHADLDPAAGARAEDIQSEKQDFIKSVPASLRPSVVIDSGNGLQLIWRLDRAIDLRERADREELIQRVERVNKALSEAVSAPMRYLQADSTQNIDRILRVPGTMNVPNRKKREAGRGACLASVLLHDPARVFTLDAIEACLQTEFPGHLDDKLKDTGQASNVLGLVFNRLERHRRASAYRNANVTKKGDDPANRQTRDLELIAWHLSNAEKADGRSPSSSKLRRLWRGDFSDYSGNSEGMMALLSMLAAELPGWVTVSRLYQLVTNAQQAVEAYNRNHSGDKWARRGRDDCTKAIMLRQESIEAKKRLQVEAESLGVKLFLQAAGFTDGTDSEGGDQVAHHQIAALDKFSDLANAQRLLNHHGKDLLFINSKEPLRWDGNRWLAQDTNTLGDLGMVLPMQLSRLIEEHEVRAIKEEIDRLEQDEGGDSTEFQDLLEQYEEWQKESESKSHIEGASVLFRKALTITPDRLNTGTMTIVCENGTIDLETGTCRPSHRLDLDTRCIAAKYDPTARCPRFEQFLDEVFESNKDLIRYVQQLFGQTLQGKVTEHILPVLWGSGRNGKGTFIGLMQRIMGPYATTIPADRLLAVKGASRDVERTNAAIHGKRMVIAQESGNSAYLEESWIKTISGGDRLSARALYRESFDFDPQHTMYLITNHKPQIQGKDDGVWGRLRLIPFQAQFMEGKNGANKPDPNLGEKLWAERDGVLRWLLVGLRDYQENGLITPDEVMEATAQYRENEDRMLLFLEEWMLPAPGESVLISHVYKSHRLWCEQEEGAKLTMKRKTFVEALASTLHNGGLPGRIFKCTSRKQDVLEGWKLKPADQRPMAQF